MAELRWTREAEQWLKDILEYIARDNPALSNLLAILHGMGLRITIQPEKRVAAA
jgi:hypothetical protein